MVKNEPFFSQKYRRRREYITIKFTLKIFTFMGKSNR